MRMFFSIIGLIIAAVLTAYLAAAVWAWVLVALVLMIGGGLLFKFGAGGEWKGAFFLYSIAAWWGSAFGFHWAYGDTELQAWALPYWLFISFVDTLMLIWVLAD